MTKTRFTERLNVPARGQSRRICDGGLFPGDLANRLESTGKGQSGILMSDQTMKGGQTVTTPSSASYEALLLVARTIVRAGADNVEPDTVLDAQADLVMHACVVGYEDEFDTQLDYQANDEQREEAAQLAEELDKLHSVLWNRSYPDISDAIESTLRRRRK